MSKVKQQDKIKELEERINYLESRKIKLNIDWKPLIATIILIPLTIFWLYQSIVNWGMFEIFNLEPAEIVTISNLIVIPNILFNYLLISLTIISLVALIKGGYNKLKKYNEEGLIEGLIVGLIWGLIEEKYKNGK